MSNLTIVGGGMGDTLYLTGEAKEAIAGAALAYATPRLARELAAEYPHVRSAGYKEILAALETDTPQDTAVVVSGDTGFHSLARTLARRLGSRYRIRQIAGVSSLQMLCARLGIGYEDIKVVSTHGRSASVLGAASYHQRVFVLTGGGEDIRRILSELCGAGLGDLEVWAAQNLGAPDEQISHGTPASLEGAAFGELVVLLLCNPGAVNPQARLADADFMRGKTPMTKEAVRVLSVNRLAVEPGDVVYDIGAGTGSVSVALARAARDGVVYSIERDAEALELLGANRTALGACNLLVVKGEAPGALAGLPPPRRVFIGGSGGKLWKIITLLTEKSPDFTLCINAITLETLGEALNCLEKWGFSQIEVECVNIAGARQAGEYHMMSAQNPVYIISGRWTASR